MQPTTPPDDQPDTPGRNRQMVLLAVLVVLGLILALVVLWIANADDDDDVITGDEETTTTVGEETTTTAQDTTTTTAEATTTTTEAMTTTTEPTQDGLSDDEAATVVWPDPDGGETFSTPEDAVVGFAEDLVGFNEPTLGEFRQGDSRSGEIDVTGADDRVTTVLVRQLGDDNWYVLGSTTADIEVDDPGAGDEVGDPVAVSGRARAFEGNVVVRVHGHGSTDAVGEGFVTGGGGGELEAFSGEIEYENPGGRGAVLFLTHSAQDGDVVQVVAVPVGFPPTG